MIDLLPYQKLIEQAITNLQFPLKPNDLYDPLKYFMKLGGKRMRPILALMACEIYNKPPEKAIHAALAVEIFHNFSLIHDDIMDQAPLRRGQETVHQKWNENVAILSGDVLLVKAYEQLVRYDNTILKDLMVIFNETAIKVCEGQQMDMDFETMEQVSIAEYLKMIEYKTAVLLGCSLEMGAIVANANENDKQSLYNFGVNLGIAFQLQDDLLDVYADQDKFGKQIGGDIIANKKTYLLLSTLKSANTTQLDDLKLLYSETNNQLKVEGFKRIYAELNIKTITEEKIDHYYQIAIQSLNNISVSETLKKPLYSLSNFLLKRES